MRVTWSRFGVWVFAVSGVGAVACSATSTPELAGDPLDQPVFAPSPSLPDGSAPSTSPDASTVSLADAAVDSGNACLCGGNLPIRREDCCAPPSCVSAGGNTCGAEGSSVCKGQVLLASSDCFTCCYIPPGDSGLGEITDAARIPEPDAGAGETPDAAKIPEPDAGPGEIPDAAKIPEPDAGPGAVPDASPPPPPPPPPPPTCGAAGGNTCAVEGSTVCNGYALLKSSDCAICCFKPPPPPPPPACGTEGGNTCGAAGSSVCDGYALLTASDCPVCCYKPPPACAAAGGNTCGPAGSEVCAGQVTIASSDCPVCCYVPPPPPPPLPTCGNAGGNRCGGAGSAVCAGYGNIESSDCPVCCYIPPPPPPPVCGVAGGNTCGPAGSPVCAGHANIASSDCPVCCYIPPPPPPPVCGVAGGNTCGAAGSNVCDGYALLSSSDCPVCCYKPPPPTCDIYVHVHANSNQWFAVWAPATPLKNGQDDPSQAVLNRAGASGAMSSLGATTFIDGFTLQTRTNGQPGSYECPAYYSESYSPLVIDLSGHGITLTPPNAGVRFDIVGDGTKTPISWPVDPEDAVFLALPDATGNITSVDQLFGNNTRGPDGETAKNGFAALAKYDANHDQSIDAHDAVFSSLRLWSDTNKNGTVEPGELVPLVNQGIVAIDLRYVNKVERSDFYGNESRERSHVATESGKTLRIFDIWFVPGVPAE